MRFGNDGDLCTCTFVVVFPTGIPTAHLGRDGWHTTIVFFPNVLASFLRKRVPGGSDVRGQTPFISQPALLSASYGGNILSNLPFRRESRPRALRTWTSSGQIQFLHYTENIPSINIDFVNMVSRFVCD